jgi:NDP-sugar pyrophosphorylase family protein
MAEVGGRPFVEWLLRMVAGFGVRRAVLCVGHLGDVVRSHFGDGRGVGLEIGYSEDVDLGTGGAVRKALPLTRSDPVLVLNGDSYCEVDLAAFLEWHRARGAEGSLLLSQVQDTGRFGAVRTDPDGCILSFEEKADSAAPGWINAGIYLLSRNLLGAIPTVGPVSIEREVFPGSVGGGLYGYRGGGRFIDIGVPESYAKAAEFFGCAGRESVPAGDGPAASPPSPNTGHGVRLSAGVSRAQSSQPSHGGEQP